MGKTASSMRTNRLWEGAISFGFLPAGAREDSQRGRTSCDVRIQHPGPKGNILSWEVTLGHKPPGGNKEEPNFPLIPEAMIKAPFEHVKKKP
jgi:hypothetical protein